MITEQLMSPLHDFMAHKVPPIGENVESKQIVDTSTDTNQDLEVKKLNYVTLNLMTLHGL